MTEHTPIPDAIPANLADLLARKSSRLGCLPDIHFSDDNSAELAVLISMLVSSSSSKPDHRQYLMAAQMMVMAITDTFRSLVERSVNERANQSMVALIAQAAAGLGIAQFVLDNLMVLHKRLFEMNTGGRVSQQFLESIGMDRDAYEAWTKSNSSSNH
jgi:hypothetical protein